MPAATTPTTTPRIFRYPDVPPVGSAADAGLEGLGASWSPGGEGLTQWVDYIKFESYKLEYSGSAILDSFKDGSASANTNAGRQVSGDTVYLYMPASIAASYSTNYNQTAFGVGGVMAAQMLGSSNSTDIATALQNAAAGATPEAALSAVGNAVGNLNSALGLGGSGVSGSDLAAVTQGRVFNPYEEQIFQGVNFRTHSFQFKLIARDRREAEQIEGIVKFFKKTMLPSYTGDIGNTTAQASSGGGQTVGQSLNFPGSGERRYLKVPSRVKVEFIRINRTGNTLASTGSSTVLKLFNFKDCIIDSFQANYTPDGGYVNTQDGYVPALDIQVSLKEVALVTADDVDGGF